MQIEVGGVAEIIHNTSSVPVRRQPPLSPMQYLSWWNSYRVAIDAALRMPQYRVRAKNIAQSRGLIAEDGNNRKKRGGGKDAKEWKAEEEAIIRSIVEENLNIT